MTFYVSRSAFIHPHFVDGVWILHSHPFSHDHVHTHSCVDYTYLDRYTSFATTEIVFLELFEIRTLNLFDVIDRQVFPPCHVAIDQVLSRGP